MTDQAITTSVRQISPTVSVIDIGGSVTRAADQALTNAYHEASAEKTRAIVLNFSNLEYMNSSGIGLLVTFLIRANRQKQHLLAYGLSDHYKHIFELTRLNEAIGIYDTEAQTMEAAGRIG